MANGRVMGLGGNFNRKLDVDFIFQLEPGAY